MYCFGLHAFWLYLKDPYFQLRNKQEFLVMGSSIDFAWDALCFLFNYFMIIWEQKLHINYRLIPKGAMV